MNRKITSHPNYTAADYAYLQAKGWSDQEILARWDEEHGKGSAPVTWAGRWNQSKLHAVTA